MVVVWSELILTAKIKIFLKGSPISNLKIDKKIILGNTFLKFLQKINYLNEIYIFIE